MLYYDESEAKQLRERVEALILHWPKVTTRRMFGCPAYLADGKLFAFLVTGGVVITQIRQHDREALARVAATEPFMAGEREITRWLKVSVDDETMPYFDRVMALVRKSYDTVLAY